MPPKKGNKNALKHGLYASHISDDLRPELFRMPTDEALMELAAARISAARAMDIWRSAQSMDDKARAISIAIQSLEAAVNIMAKNALLAGSSPVISELWDAIDQANHLDGWSNDL